MYKTKILYPQILDKNLDNRKRSVPQILYDGNILSELLKIISKQKYTIRDIWTIPKQLWINKIYAHHLDKNNKNISKF